MSQLGAAMGAARFNQFKVVDLIDVSCGGSLLVLRQILINCPHWGQRTGTKT